MARGIYWLGNIKSRGAKIVMTDSGCKKKLELYDALCSLYALKNMIKDVVKRLWVNVSILSVTVLVECVDYGGECVGNVT